MTLATHLQEMATTVCWCWKVTRQDGQVFGFTEHDRTLEFDGCSYEPEAGFTASSLQESSDLSVDSQDVQGALTSDLISESDLLSGVWDSADIQVYLVNWKNTSQRLLVRRGNLGQVSRGKNAFTAEVRSFAAKLTEVKGRFYQYFCDARLGDNRCGVLLAQESYLSTGTVTELRPYNRVITTGPISEFDDDWFAYGVLTVTSGEQSGSSFTVMATKKRSDQVDITFFSETTPELSEGDTFSIVAGCDKSFATCRSKFSNAVNFRGFPHIPGNALLQRYPKERGIYGGGPVKK